MGKSCCKEFILMELWKPCRFEVCPHFQHFYYQKAGTIMSLLPLPFATQFTFHFLWDVIFEDTLPRCCLFIQQVHNGKYFTPAAALAPVTALIKHTAVIWLPGFLSPNPHHTGDVRRPGSCLIPFCIRCAEHGA